MIVSPNTAVQQGLTALCQTAPDMRVIEPLAVDSDCFSAEESPHITLVDAQEFEFGLSEVQRCKQIFPHTKVVLLVEKINSRVIWEAARAGAARCVLKADSASSLLQTLHSFYKQPG